MPRGLAVAWTKGGEKQVAAIRKARSRPRDQDPRGGAAASAPRSRASRCRLPARAGANGRLFGAITPGRRRRRGRRRSAARRSTGARSSCRQPIKSLGDYTVLVRLHPEVQAKVPVRSSPADAADRTRRPRARERRAPGPGASSSGPAARRTVRRRGVRAVPRGRARPVQHRAFRQLRPGHLRAGRAALERGSPAGFGDPRSRRPLRRPRQPDHRPLRRRLADLAGSARRSSSRRRSHSPLSVGVVGRRGLPAPVAADRGAARRRCRAGQGRGVGRRLRRPRDRARRAARGRARLGPAGAPPPPRRRLCRWRCSWSRRTSG